MLYYLVMQRSLKPASIQGGIGMLSSKINVVEFAIKELKIHNPELNFFLHPDKEKRVSTMIMVSSPAGTLDMQDIWIPASWHADYMNTEVIIPLEEGGIIEVVDWVDVKAEEDDERGFTADEEDESPSEVVERLRCCKTSDWDAPLDS